MTDKKQAYAAHQAAKAEHEKHDKTHRWFALNTSRIASRALCECPGEDCERMAGCGCYCDCAGSMGGACECWSPSTCKCIRYCHTAYARIKSEREIERLEVELKWRESWRAERRAMANWKAAVKAEKDAKAARKAANLNQSA